MAGSAHPRASTMPKLQTANTVTCGLLKWATCSRTVAVHCAMSSWRVMLPLVHGGRFAPHSFPEDGRMRHLIIEANCPSV